MVSTGIRFEIKKQGSFTFDVPRGVDVIECNKVWFDESVFPSLDISMIASTVHAITIAVIASSNVLATLALKFLTRDGVGGACVPWRTFQEERFSAHMQGNIVFGCAELLLTPLFSYRRMLVYVYCVAR